MIDIDRSGTLSYEEVLDLSRVSLLRSFHPKDPKEVLDAVEGMARHFSDFIFKIAKTKKEDEIEFDVLKQVIK